MVLIDALGALLTLIALGFLGLTGYFAALLALGDDARRDPLTLAIGTLLASTAVGLGLGLLLGGLGILRLEIALAALAVLALVLVRAARSRSGDVGAPARLLLERLRARAAESLALTILAVHAIGSEAVRGLLRPPLSWDSLMYHLLLTATWFHDGNLAPVFGPKPIAFYGYVPANGSLWLWWWMAPSHSELWVNLGFLPHLLLLGLATGGVARALGAVRHWPAAAFCVLLLPTVVRFAATQYVDIFLAAGLVAALHFGLRWLERPRAGDALLAGFGLGMAGGAKVLGGPYAFFLGAALGVAGLLAARGDWGRRVRHLLLALAVVIPLGGFFYLRNLALGVGPVAVECEGVADLQRQRLAADRPAGPTFPRLYSVLWQLGPMLEEGSLLDAFLGVTQPSVRELGVGPVAPLLLLGGIVFPLLLGGDRHRAAWLVHSQVVLQLVLWLTVPAAPRGHIFANIRYLIPVLALALAGGAAALEARKVGDRWIRGLALAVSAQGLLQLHAEMPRGVRLLAAVLMLVAGTLAFAPALRASLARRSRLLTGAAVAAVVLGAPFLGLFRADDRGRAFAQEFTAHATPAPVYARAWAWLDENGGDGTVAVVGSPRTRFVYPAMGPRLERRAIYVNINQRDLRNAGSYPRCDPRVDPDFDAWLGHLAAQDVRWLHTSRLPNAPFPGEAGWAEERPDLFALRYEDDTNRIYELLPVARAGREP